jgi:hypothetical protein
MRSAIDDHRVCALEPGVFIDLAQSGTADDEVSALSNIFN